MQQVAFVQMKDGTAEDYALLGRLEDEYKRRLPERIIQSLKSLENTLSGYKVSRLEHVLQSATHALRANEPTEMVVAALLHDIGDELAPYSHSEFAAAVLRPFVSEKIYWIVKYHGLFQMYYYAHFCNGDRHARERFKHHQWFDDAVYFVEHYDQNCFDPDFDSEPLETFEPMIRELFAGPGVDAVAQRARFGT